MNALRIASDGWRDVFWFDELLGRIAGTGRGELWFVAGNRSGLLDQVRARARDAPNCIAVGPDRPDGTDEITQALVGAAGTAMGVVVNPVAELALVLGDVGRRLFRDRIKARTPDAADVFGYFDDLVSAASAGGDTLVFIVNADSRDEDLWNRRFTQYTARAGRLKCQPLALIVGLPDAPADPSDVNETFPALVQNAAELADEGKAKWHWVPPLSPELAADVLPLAAETARLLVTVTGGDDQLAAHRWNRWVDDAVVRLDRNGVWSLTGDPTDHVLEGVERAFDRVFGTDRSRTDRGQMALTCAALLDDEFCCETVLQAMVFAGEDYDAAENDLDALLGDDTTPGLLHHAGHDPNLPGRKPEYLWRYQFDDPAVAVFYRTAPRDDTERERYVRSLLDNLVRLRLHDGRFDLAIGRLAREVGEDAIAKMIEERVATRQELERLDTDATVLLSLAATWDPTELYLCDELTTLSERSQRVGLADLAVACGFAALSLARAHPDPPESTLAAALYHLGVAHRERGELDQAISYLAQALPHYQRLFDEQRTPAHRKHLALNLYELGGSHGALALYELGGSHGALNVDELGGSHGVKGDLDKAIDYLAEALPHNQTLFDQHPTPTLHRDLALNLYELGVAHRIRGELDRAEEYLKLALFDQQTLFDEQPTPTHLRELAVTLYELGGTHLGRREPDQAIGYLARSLEHRRVLLDERPTPTHRRGLALTLYDLGLAHWLRDELGEAKDYLARALFEQQRLFDEQPTLTHRRDLDGTVAALREVEGPHDQQPEPSP